MITSIEQAINILVESKKEIPYDAIKFLYNHPKDQKISDAIIYYIERAYEHEESFEDIPFDVNTPLWFSIVAENHLSEDLLMPVARIFRSDNYFNDYLQEQGLILIEKLFEKFPSTTTVKAFELTKVLVEFNADLPYASLFNCFRYIDIKKEQIWFEKTIQNPLLICYDYFIEKLADIRYKEFLPLLKEMKEKITSNYLLDQINDAIDRLESEIDPSPYEPSYVTRGDWETYFRDCEEDILSDDEHEFGFNFNHRDYDDFDDDDDDEEDEDEDDFKVVPIQPVKAKEKISRNESCPCGSGKKFKKCCAGKGVYD
jgi:hypothetical protein